MRYGGKATYIHVAFTLTKCKVTRIHKGNVLQCSSELNAGNGADIGGIMKLEKITHYFVLDVNEIENCVIYLL